MNAASVALALILIIRDAVFGYLFVGMLLVWHKAHTFLLDSRTQTAQAHPGKTRSSRAKYPGSRVSERYTLHQHTIFAIVVVRDHAQKETAHVTR